MKCKNCKAEIKTSQKFCPKCGMEIKTKKKLSKKAQAFIACVCCLILIITGTIGGLYFYQNNHAVDDPDSNYIALEAGFTDVKVTDEKTALEAIESVADVIGIDDVQKGLLIERIDTIGGINYYRFNQNCNAVPVDGKFIIIAADKEGEALALTSNYENTDMCSLHLNDNLTQNVVSKNIQNAIGEAITSVEELDTQKIVCTPSNNEFIYAYKLLASTESKLYIVYINVEDGTVIKYNNSFDYTSAEVVSEDGTSKAIGWKNDDGSYHLYNDEHKISVFDFSQFSESKQTNWNFKELGIDTMYSESNIFNEKGIKLMSYLCQFDDYFVQLGDKGFDRIHAAINDSIGSNASADGAESPEGKNEGRVGALFVGEERNIDDVDIIAHEYTHMVSKAINRWSGKEPSALNEGISDIFGEIIESSIKGNCDWKHDGRNIADPENKNNKQRYPATVEYLEKAKKNGDNYFINGNSLFGGQTEDYSHFASVIISHCAYLMNNGIDGNNEKKINTDLLGQLWYNALYLMQPDSSFEQCRCAIELSSRIMLKNKELTQEQYNCVCEAFDTVGIENANYTYQSKVKNDFNLKVLSSKDTDNVNFNLKIYKLRNYEFDIKSIIKQPKLVLEENSLYGNKQIHLDDGVYYLEIMDLDENAQNSIPIKTKIIVDGDDENTVDEVIIKTDFSDITTVILNKDEEDKNLATLPGEYVFSSGVSAWSTELNINEDFTFSGMYYDSELGLTGEKNPNGTVIICEFTGTFSIPEKIDDYTYKLTVKSISLKHEDGYVYYDNGIEYECVGEPYGFDGCKEFYLYIKGRQANDLSEDFLGWIYEYDEKAGILPCNCIRNPQTNVCFVKYESTEANDAKDMQSESTTVKESTENNVGRFYGNETAEQLRKSIIGSWGALGSIVPEYNFFDDQNCSGDMPWRTSGTYSISDNKTLTIKWAGESEKEEYIWSEESWDDFYSHHEYGTDFWYMTDDGVLKLNGKEKYRDGVDNFTYNSDGDLMKSISGTWINDTRSKEYRIYDDGTWEESTIYISGGHLISRNVLDNGKVEIIDDTTAKLWQEVEHLNQIPGASELIYDNKTDNISVGGTNNTYSRAKYK